MRFNEYRVRAENTAVYPGAGTENDLGRAYTALGLVGEAGEVAKKVKKFLRGDDKDDPKKISERRLAIEKELGDVLWYVAMCAREWGLDLDMIASMNLRKLEERREKDTLKGFGDNW